MCKRLILSASIISGDFLKIGDQLDELMESDCNEIHFDVMDGNFVPNLSAGPIILDSIKEKIKCNIDIHLMVKTPMLFIENFSKIGADIITFHLESDDDPMNVINKIKPNVYCKGPDYKNNRQDITGEIKNEIRAIKKSKG